MDALATVKLFYSSLAAGDSTAALRLLDPEVEWTEAERTPYFVGTMRGPDAVIAGLFQPLGRDFYNFTTSPSDFVTEGSRVVSFGRYSGIAKLNGRTMSAPFVHVWTVSDGRLRRFVRFTDSAPWNEALIQAQFPALAIYKHRRKSRTDLVRSGRGVTRPLSHRLIFEIHNPVWGRTADEFGDKGAPDIVLLNRAKTSRNQPPQPSHIARRVSIACDNSRTKNREALEAYPLNRLFFQPHDPGIANYTFRGASRCPVDAG
jgi:uncharacterized protein